MSKMGLDVQEIVWGENVKNERKGAKKMEKIYKAYLTLLKERRKERKIGYKESQTEQQL